MRERDLKDGLPSFFPDWGHPRLGKNCMIVDIQMGARGGTHDISIVRTDYSGVAWATATRRRFGIRLVREEAP